MTQESLDTRRNVLI